MALSAEWVESVVDEAAAQVEVPGISVAVFHDATMIQCRAGRAQIDPERLVRPDDFFPIWSITKILTATLVMILADRGLLDVGETIEAAVPGIRLAGGAAHRITVRQLLSHTSGLPNAIADTGAGDDCREQFVRTLASVRLVAEPGETFFYSNPGYIVLGHLVEVLTGTTWEQALCELVLDPAGLKEIEVPYYRPLDVPRVALYQDDEDGALVRVKEIFPTWRTGAPSASTLWGTPRALVDLGQIFFSGTAPNGRRILSASALAAMREPVPPTRSGAAPDGSRPALGWHTYDWRGNGVLVHGGGDHNVLSVVPSSDLAVAVMTNGPGGEELRNSLSRRLIEGATRPE